ncbi:signal transduction histidine kinase [Paenibacillus shirakamiensis]|uniref:histidine kinase n=1 Tax=Paenibacillus shirakamiensis TaxID=1265935 RepID=A0ABS4JJ11_9BACL|nr:histidine kinase dimerization/phospho-acceptor domain-containing protein [Paenibacillus shirakamiensis]MBP2001677.1 signal transduction histidine kinase [Paenibacillus shirakamiensis]
MEYIRNTESGFFHDLNTAAEHIINFTSGMLNTNTIFIASNDGMTNTIIKAFNRKEQLVQEGDCMPFEASYCSLVLGEERAPLYIPDTSVSPLTSHLKVTEALGGRSFIGLPILLKDGSSYGTICAMDQVDYPYADSDVNTLNSMALFLAYVIELEHRVNELDVQTQILLDAKAEVENSSILKGNLIEMIVQEIRNPMNGVVGMTQLMMDSRLTPEQQEYIRILDESNHSLLTLLEDIQDYGKLNASGITAEQEPFDFNSTLSSVITQLEPMATDKRTALVHVSNPNIPSVLLGDALKLRQTLVNLTTDVLKLSKEGAVVLSSAPLPHSEYSKFMVEFSVTCTGLRLTADQLNLRLRSNSLPTSEVLETKEDVSLNWAISHKLIQIMGGALRVQRGLNQEIIIAFTLPFHILN